MTVPRRPLPAHGAIDIAATTAIQALASLAGLALPAIAPLLAAGLGVAPTLVGYWVSLVYALAMATSLAGGAVVGRLGPCRTSQLALVLCGAGCALAAVPLLPMMALAAVLVGLGYGLVNPASSHLLARSTSANRNLIFSIKQTGVPIGGTLAGMAAPPLAEAFGWQAVPATVAVLALLLALLIAPRRDHWDVDRDPKTRLGRRPFAGLAAIWRQPPLRALSLSAFFFAVVQLCLVTFLVTMLVTEAGFTLVAAGVALSVAQVSGVGGRLLWGLLADRIGGPRVLVLLALTMVAGAALTGAMTSAWPAPAVFATLILFGLSAIGWNGVYLAEIARITPPAEVGRITGGSLFFTFGGVLVGPSAFAALYHAFGSLGATFGLLAGAALAGLVLVVAAQRGNAVTGPAPRA